MTNGIILAGGRGTRLGPLAAQISKALVSIGQRPHLAHQVELLRKNGCDNIVVVTSPDTNVQVSNMITRAGLIDVYTIVQLKPRGPVDAIRTGMEVVNVNKPTVVLMADTYLDEALPDHGSWVAMADAPYTRSFCFQSGDGFADGTASPGRDVTVGAYRFSDTMTAYGLAAATVRKHTIEAGPLEVGMAPFLTAWVHEESVSALKVKTWLDLGDVKALARARQSKFIARDHHMLSLSDHGTLTKTGSGDSFIQQGLRMYNISNDDDPAVANLVPRVFEFESATPSYTMEFIDLPTLSELWLYWPGRPETWADILLTVIRRLEPLWGRTSSAHTYAPWSADREYAWYADKALSRVLAFDDKFGTKWLARVAPLVDSAKWFFSDDAPVVRAHGDLNFNNILYSLNSGMVKLVDPRGDTTLPLSYELAKLRYSYHGGFSAITHGLVRDIELLPRREAESRAMDEVLSVYDDLGRLQVMEGMLLLAGAVLHPHKEAVIMLMRGVDLMEKVELI